MPSRSKIDKKLRELQMKQVFQIGNLVWFFTYFKTDPDTDGKEKLGTMAIIKPSKYFEAYDTNYQPSEKDFAWAKRKMAVGSDFSELDNVEAWEKIKPVEIVKKSTMKSSKRPILLSLGRKRAQKA